MSPQESGVFGALRRTLGDWGVLPARTAPDGPLALVYRGPATTPGCPEAVAELLGASRWNFDIRYVGPKEELPLTADTLRRATLYAQPGGGTLTPAYRKLKPHRSDIRDFVRGGGHYLGFCLGGYLAGATPGFGLLPGDTDQYIASEQSTVDTEGNTVVDVHWRGRRTRLFFQDGPYFWLSDSAEAADSTVLATYQNDRIAALVTGFGAGRVGVVGPHPEADSDWFTDAGLPDPGHGRPDPEAARGRTAGLDLIDAVMRG